jgi:hypothetical protein
MKNRKQISFQMGKLPSMMSWWRRHCEMAAGYQIFGVKTPAFRQGDETPLPVSLLY